MGHRHFAAGLLLIGLLLMTAACSGEEGKQKVRAMDPFQQEQEEQPQDTGVELETFVQRMSAVLPDDVDLDPQGNQYSDMNEGRAVLDAPLGEKGHFYAVVDQKSHHLVELKISCRGSVVPSWGKGVLRAFHPDRSDREMEGEVNRLFPEDGGNNRVHHRLGHMKYVVHRSAEGWALVARPQGLAQSVLDLALHPEAEGDPSGRKADTGDGGGTVVSNPASFTVLVNKSHSLPPDYVPPDLVIPQVRFSFNGYSPKKNMRREAAQALERLFAAADDRGFRLFAQSGYRSYQRQQAIFALKADQVGKKRANQVSARPGQSEHQTGLSMDITSQSVAFQLVESFGQTPEGRWVAENAHRFGFIIRYPKGKEQVTRYQYEPCHLRYVGVSAAGEMYRKQQTLEEYLGKRD
ncbi:MAG: M15 family metallopeptidase [Firmicutes bacterium]|nr:M15 family metallopeptidase [Bacillota bacterium]